MFQKNMFTLFFNSSLLRKTYLFIGLLWAIPISIFIRILRPIIHIRFGRLLSPYIGHYAGDTEIYLSEKIHKFKLDGIKYFDIWFHSHSNVCNSQLRKMIERTIIILPRVIIAPIHKLNYLIDKNSLYIAKSDFHDRDINNILDITKPSLKFTSKEIIKGDFLLKKMGITDDIQFICLLVRDDAYHNNMGYTNYRNVNIETFYPAITNLTNKGLYVIRMGKKVKKKLEIKHNYIIDYANSIYRSDFLDIYLASKCKFVITTSSGWDMVASTIFRKPILYTNMVPISQIMTWSHRHVFLLKRHLSKTNNKYLTMTEIFRTIDNQHNSSEPRYNELNIELQDNNATEITNSINEILENFEEFFVNKTFSISKNQKDFWNLYKENIKLYNLQKYHGNINSYISETFLNNAKEFLN